MARWTAAPGYTTLHAAMACSWSDVHPGNEKCVLQLSPLQERLRPFREMLSRQSFNLPGFLSSSAHMMATSF